MSSFKECFINFIIENKIISFGEFCTKSGRNSPYFFNLGKCYSGDILFQLGEFFAECIHNNIPDKENLILYGPSYKGISLVIATAIALKIKYNIIVNYCYDRKEYKNHGDKGIIVGYQINEKDRVILLDDVITSGISIINSFDLIDKLGAKVDKVFIALDRQEKAENSNMNAKSYLINRFNTEIISLVDIDNVIDYSNKYCLLNEEQLKNIQNYRKYK